jgi:hypothetical protein
MRTTVVTTFRNFFLKKRFTDRQVDDFGDSLFATIGLLISTGALALLGYILWNLF